MLKLVNIKKDYITSKDSEPVHALRGINLEFKDSEFVAILGQSGCGKTTLLNIIGGLDKYSEGDLIINNVTTKDYDDRDWDTYRNHSIGFIFQSYNLIMHQNVLSNVELALTIGGVDKKDRKERAITALEKVGLKDQIYKLPNQLSGGQMQRVAIARAIVNNPDIILADEPTGALDSKTSIQIMDILKELAKDRLIIMVTHNPDLAKQYSTRIVTLVDGLVTDDTLPFDSKTTKTEQKKYEKKSSMSFKTAMQLSANNLKTKKGRTGLTSFAGSIGIIGIATILSMSSGIQNYINRVQEETLTSYPIEIASQTMDYSSLMGTMMNAGSNDNNVSYDDDKIHSSSTMTDMVNALLKGVSTNDLRSFKQFIEQDDCKIKEYGTVQYTYFFDPQIYNVDPYYASHDNIPSNDDDYIRVNPTNIFDTFDDATGMEYSSFLKFFDEIIPNQSVLESQYSVVAGTWPVNYNDIVLVVDENNMIDDMSLYALGFKNPEEAKQIIQDMFTIQDYEITRSDLTLSYDEILNTKFNLLLSTQYFSKTNTSYVADDGNTYPIWEDKTEDFEYIRSLLTTTTSEELNIVGIIKPSEDAVATSINGSIGYTHALTEHIISRVNEQEIVIQQVEKTPEYDVLKGTKFTPYETLNSLNYKKYWDEFKDSTFAAIFKLNSPDEYAIIEGLMKNETYSDTVKISAFQRLYETYSNNQNQLYNYSTSTIEDNEILFGIEDVDNPYEINIFPTTFEGKELIQAEISRYNSLVSEDKQITYNDMVGMLMGSISTIINVISWVLIAFVAISLIVSSIMIGIITYISVLERTKEIGVLRSLGASKKDVSRVFNAETMIIGLISGLLGIGITLLIVLPINIVIKQLFDIANIAQLPVVAAIILVAISVTLTLISGLIPSRVASKKDPVIALRNE